MILFISGGILIIIVLAVIAYRLQKRVNQIEFQQAERERQFQEKEAAKRSSMNKSIQVLAQGILDDQVTKTEGAIRIAALMEFLGVGNEIKESFSAFFQLAEATAHIPMLDKWRALPTKEKLRYDNERVNLEKTYNDFVIDAAKRIIGQQF